MISIKKYNRKNNFLLIVRFLGPINPYNKIIHKECVRDSPFDHTATCPHPGKVLMADSMEFLFFELFPCHKPYFLEIKKRR